MNSPDPHPSPAGESASQPQEEQDLLAGAPVAAPHNTDESGDPGEPPAPPVLPEFQGHDLLGEDDLKAVMAQFSPQASKDITAIQKGVENFFLFHQSHLALTHREQLSHLSDSDLSLLADREAIVPFQYLKLGEDRASLVRKDVWIRPASLKAEQVAKVKRACVRGSVTAILEYIYTRDAQIRDLESKQQLGQWVSQRFLKDEGPIKGESRAELNRMLAALRNLSFDSFLVNELEPREDLLAGVFALLHKPAAELGRELAEYTPLSTEAAAVIHARATRPMLFALSRDFHLVQPPAADLIALPDSRVQERRSELEWTYLLYVQLARRILFVLLPRDETEWIQPKGVTQDERYLEELKKHPSFLGENWHDGAGFLTAFATLIKQVRAIRTVRREYLIELITQQSIQRLNMQFEPVLFSLATFETPDRSIESYIPRNELYRAVIDRMKQLPELVFLEERRVDAGPRGTYYMYRANLAQGFIRNSNRRNYLHQLCRANGHARGIYDLLREVDEDTTPAGIVQEQLDLARAIRDWEDELERERLRRERAGMGLFARLMQWLTNLFGLEKQKRRAEDSDGTRQADTGESAGENTAENTERRRRTGVIKGPREKEITIPTKIQKAVDYVERNFRGLIWLDEVLAALNSVKFTSDQIGDMLFYDRHDRYEEARALINIRRVFLTRKNSASAAWLQSTIDYLENISTPKEEHKALVKYLQALLREVG